MLFVFVLKIYQYLFCAGGIGGIFFVNFNIFIILIMFHCLCFIYVVFDLKQKTSMSDLDADCRFLHRLLKITIRTSSKTLYKSIGVNGLGRVPNRDILIVNNIFKWQWTKNIQLSREWSVQVENLRKFT